MFTRCLAIGILAAVAAGCGASVDAQGKILSDRVWFDQAGVAHCPHPDCLPVPKLNPAPEETAASLVKPHRNVCEKGHPVQWGADDVTCWACQGARTCPTCQGTGLVGKDIPCPGCLAIEADGRVAGTGVCSECGGKGTIRYGGTVLAPH